MVILLCSYYNIIIILLYYKIIDPDPNRTLQDEQEPLPDRQPDSATFDSRAMLFSNSMPMDLGSLTVGAASSSGNEIAVKVHLYFNLFHDI